jgi:hypothetical protein
MFFPNMNEKVKEIRASYLKTSTFILDFFLKKLQRNIHGTFFLSLFSQNLIKKIFHFKDFSKKGKYSFIGQF